MPTANLDQAQAKRIIDSISIPPRPTVIAALAAEQQKDDPDLSAIAKLVSADVSLAAAVLKTANSPLFGLARKISSIPQALSVLGTRNVFSIITGIALRALTGGSKSADMERFWDTTEDVAALCSRLARMLRAVTPEEAHSYGLFHDCGMPILMQRFANYHQLLAIANADASRPFTTVEDEALSTNHAVVGHMLARSWLMPEQLTEAILIHHEAFCTDFENRSGTAFTLAAIGHLAENFYHVSIRGAADVEWEKNREAVMDHLNLSDTDLTDLLDGLDL
jgi:HD-like signal output (HDOD) protein